MKNRSSMGGLFAAGAFAMGLIVLNPIPTPAQEMVRRQDRWQFAIPINFVAGKEIDGAGESFVDISDDVGWGFSFGYHLNQRFYLGFETTWLRTSYDATIEIDDDEDMDADDVVTLGGTLDASTFGGVGQFNLLEGSRFTPYVQGRLGFTYADSNIPSGPTEGVCWWDPWWGYICNTWRPTYSETAFSYGLGAGVRADLGRRFFLELGWNGSWVNFDESTPFFNGVRLNLGWLF